MKKTWFRNTHFFGMLLGVGGFFIAKHLPDAIAKDIVNFAYKIAFGGGILSASLFVLIKNIKGDTKKLLQSPALNDMDKIRLGMAIKRRNKFLNMSHWKIVGLVALTFVFHYIDKKGYWHPTASFLAFSFICISIPYFIQLFFAWRDYMKTKETLDFRENGLPDI